MSEAAGSGELRAEGLSFRIGSSELLRDVSIDVRPGRVTAVLGPNGAGKSTLLRLLSGDMHPSAGRVTLDERPLHEWKPQTLALRRAVMPQSSTLTFPFTALQVAALGRIPYTTGLGTARDHAVALGALARAGADHLSHRLYPTLSGGERQRVDYARALAQVWSAEVPGARYLLLDEPTSSLDLARQHELLDSVRSFAQEGVGVFIVLHDLNLAAEYADEVTVLREGAVVCCGPPRAALTASLVERAFSLRVLVTSHPRSGRPIIVPDPTRDGASTPDPGLPATPSLM